MKKFVGLLMLFFFTSFSFGCSAFAPKTQQLSINCGEEGTTLQINGNVYSCPAQIDVQRNKSVGIMAHKEGHHSYMRTIESNANGLFVLDFVGGLIWLVPFIGLVAPGAYSLETQEVQVSMVPKDQPLPTNNTAKVQENTVAQ